MGMGVPFLASALLVAVGMWIRITVGPVFQTLDAKLAAKMPVLDALKTYPKEIALAAGSFVPTARMRADQVAHMEEKLDADVERARAAVSDLEGRGMEDRGKLRWA
jgi:hypothetical protein